MAALPYIQFYIADYLADTTHLVAEEHGAYLLLIFNYWQSGKPLPDNDTRLARIARVSNDRWNSVRASLEEFFTIVDGEWFHARIDDDLKAVNLKIEQTSKAGKASAAARSAKAREARRTRPANGRSTDVQRTYEQNGNENPTNNKYKDNKKDSRAKPRQTIPDDFAITESMREWASANTPLVNLETATQEFINYWRGEGKTKADWVATWRNSMIKQQGFVSEKSAPTQSRIYGL